MYAKELFVRSLVLCLRIPAMFGQLFNMLYSIIDRTS